MSHLCLLGVATLTLTSASFAGSDTNADLQARLEAAEARISELSAATNANWLNDARSDEIRSLVHDVLADADTRANLQGGTGTAGYSDGFTIGSADGNWSMKINGLLQERWVHDEVNDNDPATDDDSSYGFENTRTVLNFSGTIAKDYGYNVRWDAGAYVQTAMLLEWGYGTMDMGDGWEVAAGVMKLPTNREWMINAEYQLAVERSLSSQSDLTRLMRNTDNATTTGLSFNYVGDDIRFWAMYGNGVGGDTNPQPLTGYDNNENAHAWALRAEFMVEGSGWGQFDQFTSAEGGEAGTLLGISYVNNDWGEDAVDGVNSNTILSIDAQLQFGGSNLYVCYQDNDVDGADPNPTSFEVMYGIYLDDDFELFARYQDIDHDVANTSNSDAFTIGMNYYLSGQNAKWTTDISWADSGWAAGEETNWQNSADGEDQTLIRTQLQFYF